MILAKTGLSGTDAEAVLEEAKTKSTANYPYNPPKSAWHYTSQQKRGNNGGNSSPGRRWPNTENISGHK